MFGVCNPTIFVAVRVICKSLFQFFDSEHVEETGGTVEEYGLDDAGVQ